MIIDFNFMFIKLQFYNKQHLLQIHKLKIHMMEKVDIGDNK